ncbi:SCO6880 family protein [Streptosporangium sp. CA-115845]|uniref:SCO6880 family protein n=1 Tax=Streptosporangium sp. CA-115845 TaxID=3240071 RepID=UPI003D91C294
MSETGQTPYRRYTYTFGPRESTGVVLGLSMGSVLAVFAALFLLIRLAQAGALGLAAGLVIVAATVIAVWVPVADRTLAQWLPIAAAFAARRAVGYTQFRGGPAAERATGPRRRPGNGRAPHAEALELPGELAGLAILTAQVHTRHGPRNVGVIKDRRRGLYTLILSTRAGAFQLLTPQEQDQRLLRWGETLAALAAPGTGIVRIQLLDSTVPDSGQALARHWSHGGGRGSDATRDSYRDLLLDARPLTQRHDNYIGLTLHPGRARRQIRTLGGGDIGACAHLIAQAQAIQRELLNAGVEANGALAPRQIAALLRTAYDPGFRWAVEARGPDAQREGGLAVAEAGPMGCDGDHAAYYRTDGSYHAVYWISEWPRRPVTGAFLEQLLLHTRCERTLSVLLEPRDARKAEDELARAETAKDSDAGMRQRWGFRTSARDRHERAMRQRQDDALASGHAPYRFLGLIRISAPSVQALDQACGDIEINARTLKLRRLYMEQDIAFAATLPLARGLRYGLLR